MGATTTKLVATELAPIGGATNSGWKTGIIVSGAKAAQNDIWTVTNAAEIKFIIVTLDSSGAADACTISGNSVTLTGAGTGASTGMIVYR